MSRTLSVIGIGLTILYVLALGYFFNGRLDEIAKLPPNNIGDFLAGVFGPLAILWLILGFFQQGVELRQNTRALELQAEELKHSVQQQKDLVDVSRRQVEAELEVVQFERQRLRAAAQPKFVFHGTGATFTGGRSSYNSSIKNLGNTATDVIFSFEPPVRAASLTKVYSWSPGETRSLDWRYSADVAEETTLTISYVDGQGVPGEQKFRFAPVERDNRTHVEIVKCE